MIADNQDKEFRHKELTAKIIEFFLSKLGYRFFENVEVGFLFNFGPESEAKRKAFDNRREKNLKNLDNLRKSAS